jgi:hypothetical protein
VRKVSSKEGTFFEESGHDSREKISINFLAEIFFCCGRLYSVQSVRFRIVCTTVRIWHENRGNFWHNFRGDFYIFGGCFGPYGTICTVHCGHGKRGTEEAGQWYGFGMENEAGFCGTDLVL